MLALTIEYDARSRLQWVIDVDPGRVAHGHPPGAMPR